MPVHRIASAHLVDVVRAFERDGEAVVAAHPDPTDPDTFIVFTQWRVVSGSTPPRSYEVRA